MSTIIIRHLDILQIRDGINKLSPINTLIMLTLFIQIRQNRSLRSKFQYIYSFNFHSHFHIAFCVEYSNYNNSHFHQCCVRCTNFIPKRYIFVAHFIALTLIYRMWLWFIMLFYQKGMTNKSEGHVYSEIINYQVVQMNFENIFKLIVVKFKRSICIFLYVKYKLLNTITCIAQLKQYSD